MPVPTEAVRTDLSGLTASGAITRRPLTGTVASGGVASGATQERPTVGLLYPPPKRYGSST